MSASGGGAAPPDPQVEEALSRMEPAGAILPLWITMAVFGNLFAVAFLIHGLLLYMPRLRRVLSPRALLAKCLGRKGQKGDQEPSDQDGNASTSTHAAEPNGPYDTAPAVPSGKTYGMTPGGPNVADGTSAAVPAAAAGDASTCGNWKGGKGAAIGRWDSRQGGARADAAGDEEDLEGGGDFHEGVDEGPVADGGVYGGHKGAPVAGTLERALGYEDDEDEGGAGAGPQGSPLPRASRGVTLEWRDVTLRVMGVRGPLTVLRGVGGRAPAGAVTALLGPSGAGKSSLLDLLAMRGPVALSGDRHGHGTGTDPTYAAASAASAAAAYAAVAAAPDPTAAAAAAAAPEAPAANSAVGGGGGGRVCCTGQVLINGVPRSSGAFLAMSSYVPQEDSFLPQLTVREALQFAGRLLLPPPYCAPAAVSARAAAVAGALGLGRRLDNMIGGVLPGGILLRGLSGGERKRLNIGQGLLSRPRLLLLDEPTSGLDSFAAAVVMRHVADLAAGPACVAVVASLHQPRAAIWDMVDQAVVLARGRSMYSGPPYGLLPWFRDSLGYGYVPRLHGLVPDWVIDMVALTPPDEAVSTHGGAGQQPVAVGAPKEAEGQQTVAPAPAVEAPQTGGHVWTGPGQQPELDGNSGNGEGRWVAVQSVGCSTWQGHQQQQQAAGAGGEDSGSAHRSPTPSCPAHDSTAAPAHMTSLEELNSAADAFADATLSAAAAVSSLSCPAAAITAAGAVLPPSAAQPLGGAVSPGVPDFASVLLLQDIQRRQQAPSASASPPAASPCPLQHPPAATLVPSSSPTTPLSSPQGTPLANHQGTPLASPQGTPLCGGGSWLRQYRMLVWREVLLATRNPADVAGRMLTFVWVGLFANILTYSLQGDATSIALRANLLFALVFFFIVMPFIFMSLFTADKRFFLQEAGRGGAGGGLYSPSAYYVAKVTATAPLNVIIAITFDWIGYGMLGLRHSVLAVVQHTACSSLMALISLQWVQAAVAFSPNQDLAFCAAVAFAVVNLLFSTQFLGAAKLTLPWIRQLRAISALDLTWRGMVVAEFKDRAFACGPPGSTTLLGTDALGLFPQFVPNGRRFRLVKAGMTMTYDDCVVDTNALLSFYQVNGSVGDYVGWLVLYLAVVHIITYMSLRLALWRGSRAKG